MICSEFVEKMLLKKDYDFDNNDDYTITQVSQVCLRLFEEILSLNGGDSASSYRHWRNGAPHSRKRGKKMGGGRETSGNGSYFPAAHL
ncbi:MAG: hypothetical protein IKO75_13790, partial [Bacteroidales bacterium]|nr:hypothetical protein [Bacteroidales bacterium]